MASALSLVSEFCAAWSGAGPEQISERLAPFLNDDIEHQNFPRPAVRGKIEVLADIAANLAGTRGMTFEVLAIAEDGEKILTERVDVLHLPDRDVRVALMGIFVVHNDGISVWRDYTDIAAVQAQLQDGPARPFTTNLA